MYVFGLVFGFFVLFLLRGKLWKASKALKPLRLEISDRMTDQGSEGGVRAGISSDPSLHRRGGQGPDREVADPDPRPLGGRAP